MKLKDVRIYRVVCYDGDTVVFDDLFDDKDDA